MPQSILRAALYAASLALLVSPAAAQTATDLNLKPITTLGCYKDVSPLVETADYKYASDGWCQQQCGGKDKPVMAMVGGSTCYCGDVIPALDKVVANSSCNTPCNGFGTKFCGGIGFWQVWLTGLTANVQFAANGSDTPSPSGSTSAPPSVVTQVGETVVVTAPASSNGGANKVGIAVGVVVALIIVAMIVGGVVFFLRQRRKRAIEEEYQRNAAIAEFSKTKKVEVDSLTDQRLDPSFLSSHRRESIGSIADEMDFTRRILQVSPCCPPREVAQLSSSQVRNPDHRSSTASGLA